MLTKLRLTSFLLPLLFLAITTSKSQGQERIDDSIISRLVQMSSHIVYGKALSFESRYNKKGTAIFTDLTFEVYEVLKGNLVKTIITVKLPGGRVGDITMFAVGAPSFTLDEEAVLFLQKIKSRESEHFGKYYIVRMAEGKYNVYGNGERENKYVIPDVASSIFRAYPGQNVEPFNPKNNNLSCK